MAAVDQTMTACESLRATGDATMGSLISETMPTPSEPDPARTPGMLAANRRCERTRPSLRRGFTVLEILVLVAIVAILAAIALPAYQDYMIRSRTREGNPFKNVDAALAKLDWQEMAFAAPKRLAIGEEATVDVVLGGDKTYAELVRLLETTQQPDGDRLKVSDRMQATLTSYGFEIAALTPPEQPVSSTEVTRWKWQIKAKNVGSQRLTLSLNAIISSGGEKIAKSVRTFRRDIVVDVSSLSSAWVFAERYWAYLTAALGGIAAGLGWLYSRFKRRRRRS